MIISILVAMDETGCIGISNQLPWHLPADLRRFKSLTMGHHIIMGRKTYQSIGRALPGRTSIVITRQPEFVAPGCQTSPSLEAALANAKAAGESEAFIIGGGQIFARALPLAQRILLTRIHANYECEVYFPDFSMGDWAITQQETILNDPTFEHPYSYLVLERISVVKN